MNLRPFGPEAKANALLLNDYSAKDIIKNVTNILGGKGGGRNDFAQGNIVDPSKISSIKF